METTPVSEICSSLFLEYQMMERIQIPHSPEYYTPSSEHFNLLMLSSLLNKFAIDTALPRRRISVQFSPLHPPPQLYCLIVVFGYL
jgi:hypothetical protein